MIAMLFRMQWTEIMNHSIALTPKSTCLPVETLDQLHFQLNQLVIEVSIENVSLKNETEDKYY